MQTERVIITCVIWLKRIFFKNDISGVTELESLDEFEDTTELGTEFDVDHDVTNKIQT